MADIFKVGQGDTAPDIVRVLRTEDGQPIDLTGASVEIRLRHKISGRLVTGNCTISDAAGGEATYQWQVGDLSDAGEYDTKYYVTYPSGQGGTVPNDGSDTILVDPEIPSAG